MALAIRTFDNCSGPSPLFKALGHPRVAARARAFVDELDKSGALAVYDPDGRVDELVALYPAAGWQLAGVFVQRHERVAERVLGRPAQLVSELPRAGADTLLVAAFDAAPLLSDIEPLVPPGTRVVSFDALRLPDELLSVPTRYLDPLNFATNFALFRDGDGLHTRLVTANGWHARGAREVRLWLQLFDGDGAPLCSASERLPDAPASLVIDSAELRRRFDLPPFAGSLFLHAVGVAGHDSLKYVLDTRGDDSRVLTCTHDANAWPAERYAGIPAPRAGERVLLWIQNSHPAAIPAGAVGLARMGDARVVWHDEDIPGFATRALDVASLLPELRWPDQLEVRAGRHFVRPRYEVVRERDGARRVAHANVERTDLRPDPGIPELGDWAGKGFILPAPVLPLDTWRSCALPTPMATSQRELPLRFLVYDAGGALVLDRRLGRLPRDHASLLEVDALLAQSGAQLASGYGHLELAYDFSGGGEADGWLHALFRYEHRRSGRGADTSFGSHLYNLPVVYRDEPQSYTGRPPGLRTRLFLRLDPDGRDVFCQLIYPASGVWREHSDTRLILTDGAGGVVAERRVCIPRNGSLLWRPRERFDARERARAGARGYVLVRDTTVRLFGYHGLLGDDGALAFDHLFGF